MTQLQSYPAVPVDAPWNQRTARALIAALQGKINALGTVTLAASQASTTVTDPRAKPGSFIDFMPLTANAAAEWAGGSMYVSSRADGSFVIAHVDSATADRSFTYIIFG